ncbi:MAG: nicotinate (nicotinamide) nucleotide adenylyltransferase [Sulfurovum sp.]|uniref:nicotinate (nicotinamide) nucleotide adenylyltransferase n=1 Tax=Sulfurovum sp. TaxID=1969726 RepID=UPI0028680AF0|nr:nicotinate (nicotinamide) nucleotide adenylyltransferase [Sulfurovum sp.]MCO4845963.1 nicotinate (nicotinamide) nucleotide adenylyltransferase [Sulfurovum sp.]
MVNHKKPTIALFGGSFDPPHKGHQLIVEKAIENLQIDKLFVVPAYINPFKTSTLADAHTRLSWCHTLFDSIDRVKVDDYEIQEGKSTVTSQSVKHFNQTYNVKYLIIGSDNLSTLTKWHAFEWLNETVTWVIATRDNHHLDTDELNTWELLPIEAPMSSTQIREEKDLQFIDKKIRTSVKHILEGQHHMTIDERIAGIVKILDDKKAEEIEVFNLEDADYIAKRVVIANSLNGKHTLALFDHLKRELKEQGDEFLASDSSDEWAVADLGDILIHIMIPEYRQRYSLETFLSELVENQKKKDIDPA